jgi:hypothetical protein
VGVLVFTAEGEEMCRGRWIGVMEKLAVDADGKVTVPSHVLERRGLNPGEELTLVEAAEGLLIYQHGADPVTAH